MNDGTIFGIVWSVVGFLSAVVASLDWGQMGVVFVIGGMLVSATWYLGLRFSKLEGRLTRLEEHLIGRESHRQ